MSIEPSSRQPERYAWKVLRSPVLDESIGRSIAAGQPYFPRRWNHPRPGCGPLCAFEDIGDCFSLGLYPDDHLYWCAITPSTLEQIWQGASEPTPLYALPAGTLLCSRIKCLARVRFEANLRKACGPIKPYQAISVAEAQRRIAENYYHLRLEERL